jgi:hypothetical protein
LSLALEDLAADDVFQEIAEIHRKSALPSATDSDPAAPD